MPWNKDSLKEIVKEKIGNHKFIVVSCSAHRPAGGGHGAALCQR